MKKMGKNEAINLIRYRTHLVSLITSPAPLMAANNDELSSISILLAAAESEARGKYELPTTILHKMAHLYGLMEGYSRFDAFVDAETRRDYLIVDDLSFMP